MGSKLIDERIAQLNRLSERLFGEPAEVDATEAEQLLRTAGIDPVQLKGALYKRMRERSEQYSSAGRPRPPLLRQALEDLRPAPRDGHTGETTLARTAKLSIARLLREIKELPRLLNAGAPPAFTAAYRNRTELSIRDKKVLDEVAEDLRRKHRKSQRHD